MREKLVRGDAIHLELRPQKKLFVEVETKEIEKCIKTYFQTTLGARSSCVNKAIEE